MDIGATLQEFQAVGSAAPSLVVRVAIIIELGSGLALLVGFLMRGVTGILALWCLATAFAVHLGARCTPAIRLTPWTT